MNNLITKINEWADERNLKQADPNIQWMRITEEVGEIRDVLLKPTKFTEPQAALKDAIGDTLVTIIVLAHQLDLDVTECLGIAYEEIKNRKGKMVNFKIGQNHTTRGQTSLKVWFVKYLRKCTRR